MYWVVLKAVSLSFDYFTSRDKIALYLHLFLLLPSFSPNLHTAAAAAAAKSLQSCPTLCDLIDGSPPGSPIPGILQARTLEWVAISFSNAWKWKVKVKLLSRVRPYGLQPSRVILPWGFPGKSTGVGCHCLLRTSPLKRNILQYQISSRW